jgi:hypothetical protein
MGTYLFVLLILKSNPHAYISVCFSRKNEANFLKLFKPPLSFLYSTVADLSIDLSKTVVIDC